jgi:hypothetical protein
MVSHHHKSRFHMKRQITKALLVLAVAGCGDPAGPSVTSVTVTPTTASVAVGATKQLTANAVDGNGASVTAATTWSSSASSIATVSQAGLVTGVAPGSATITVTADGKTASAAITVTSALSGTWNGNLSGASLTMTLVEAGGIVNGNGTFVSGATSLSLTVTGTFAAPTVALSAAAQGYAPMNITGTLNGTTITGTVNGSGYVNTAVTLTKSQ